MIYTLTINPSVDYKIKIDEFSLGQLNRFEEHLFVAGGKGINCSIVLKNLGIENKAVAFLGGFTGAYIKKELEKKDIDLISIPIESETRMNVKVKTKTEETEINHQGPKIDTKDFDQLLDIISSIKHHDLLIIGGSSLDSIPNAYQKIGELSIKNQFMLIMDTPGRYIKEYIKFNPLLIKPNLQELEEYFETKIKNIDEIIFYGKKMIGQGARNLIISLGSEGSLYLNKDKVYQALPIDGEILSTTGAGDSMVAGFTYQYGLDQNLPMAYKMAVAASAATVFEQTLATKENTFKYLEKVIIKEILC
jgi:1-phosphofructokinase